MNIKVLPLFICLADCFLFQNEVQLYFNLTFYPIKFVNYILKQFNLSKVTFS